VLAAGSEFSLAFKTEISNPVQLSAVALLPGGAV